MAGRTIQPGDLAVINNQEYIIRRIESEGIYISPKGSEALSLLVFTPTGWQVYMYQQPHTVTFKAIQPDLSLTVQEANKVAQLGQLGDLYWLEEHHVLPNTEGADLAAQSGRLEVLKWLKERGILPSQNVINWVAFDGYLDVLKWLKEQEYPVDIVTARMAAAGGHLNVLQWLEQQGILPDKTGARLAAEHGHLNVVNWLAAKEIHST